MASTRRILAWLLPTCGALLLAGVQAATGFAPVLPDRPLTFPADTGAHPEYRTEWWYLTGWLTDDRDRTRGFQITFFRVGTGLGADNPSRFAPRQLLLAHAALADPAFGRLRHAERAERALAPLAGAATGATEVWIGDWTLSLTDGRYRTRVEADDFALDLALTPDGPPLPNGRAGFSQKTPDPVNASYYYSRPQLTVGGALRLAGTELPVRGRAWLDHEWSSELLPAAAQGWDWIGINLHDGGSLMAFRMRGRDGSTLWSAGTLQSGTAPPRLLTPDEVAFVPGRTWRSPRTGTVYPVAWTLAIAGQTWRLEPLMDDQELDARRSTGTIYWEGATRLLGGDGRELGRGYLELTGYGARQEGL